MATVTKPIALDESINTTELTPRNIADVLAEELKGIADNILPPNASQIAYDNTASGLTATNVQDAIDEVISSQADVIADTMADLTENKTATVTDGVADFETIDGSLVKSLIVEIEPSQSGSGTPSPDNIRPISGYTEEIISVKDSTDTPQATYTIPFGQTVYGGTLDVLTGELTITHKSIGASDFATFEGVTTSSGGLHYAQLDASGAKLNGKGICNIAKVDNQGAWNYTYPVAQISYTVAGRVRFYCESTSMNEFLSQYANLQIVFELDTPITVQLTPQKVKSLVGENHIQASTGDVLECKFSMLINGDDLEMLLS